MTAAATTFDGIKYWKKHKVLKWEETIFAKKYFKIFKILKLGRS